MEKKLSKSVMENTNATWQQAAHITYQLPSPSRWTWAAQATPIS